jgi:hypothetical protein
MRVRPSDWHLNIFHLTYTMRIRFLCIVVTAAFLAPPTMHAQSQDAASAWTVATALGGGVANAPTSMSPTYFDAAQFTARLAVQRALGAGLLGGMSALATLGPRGSDCTLGACAPQFRHHAVTATLTYAWRGAGHRWTPMATLGTGVARLPEQWAATPGTRTPAANTLLLHAALDVPLIVRSRTAVLLGWEHGIMPNAPGGQIATNTLVLTLRHTPLQRSAR